MAAVNNFPFRLLCQKYGADLTYTQMYLVEDLLEISLEKDLRTYLGLTDKDVLQLIGSVNSPWEDVIKIVSKFVDRVDINLGCPESKMLEKRAGSYLLNQSSQIITIIDKIKSVSDIKISAKIRSGWKLENYLEISKLLEEKGVCCIAIHPRLKTQHYTGKADWSNIKKLKEELKIPVIGNGDVSKPGHAKSMFEQTKCDGIMIGRAVMKNPGLFEEIKILFRDGKNGAPIPKTKQMSDLISFYSKCGLESDVDFLKDQLSWLSSCEHNSTFLKKKIRSLNSFSDLKRFVNSI